MKPIFALAATAVGLCLQAVAVASPADSFPDKPVRLIVPFAPGGPTDQFGRLLGDQLRTRWNQPIVVENRGGSGTILGTTQVARAVPDGYTYGMAVSAHTINPALRGAILPYDTAKDFAGVSLIGFDPMGVFALPNFPADNPEQLVALAKAKPGELAYASAGVGTALHLAGELLQQEAGIELVHVAYKGTAPAVTDVLGGTVPLLISVYSSVKPLIDDGRLKAIGIVSPDRLANLPEVPTFAETYPNVSVISANGMIAPAGTPPAILQKVSQDIAAVMASDEMKPHLERIGMVPVASTPQEYDAFIASEMAKWAKVIQERNIKPD